MNKAEQIELVDRPLFETSSSSHDASSSEEETDGSSQDSSDEEENEANAAEEYGGIFANQKYKSNDRVERSVNFVPVEEFEEVEEFDEVHPMERVGDLEQLKEIQLGEDFQGAQVTEFREEDQFHEINDPKEDRGSTQLETIDPAEGQEDESEATDMEVGEPVEEEYEEMETPMQIDDNNSETCYFSGRESTQSQNDLDEQATYATPDLDYIEPTRYSEPAGPSFHNLESFTLNATTEDLEKRMKSLIKTNTFFTREAYEAYTPYMLHPEHRALWEVILETEERLKTKKQQTKEDIIETIVPVTTQTLPVEPLPTNKHTSSEIASSSAKKRKVATTTTTTPAAHTVLDAVLTDMLRYNRSQTVKQEPADLEIAAIAAGLQSPQAPPKGNQSQFTIEEHALFRKTSEDIRNGSKNVAEADMKIYKRLYVEIKQEQEEFMQIQRKEMCNSIVYDTLDSKVEKMIEDYCEVEYDRILQYPVSKM